MLLFSRHAHAATLHRAALIIEHGSGRLITRCLAFVEDQISGLQLIQRSGIEYQAQQFGSLGSAICQLDNEPAQIPAGCFGSGPYWQYFHRTASGWAQSGAGASSSMLHDGDMDGWHYAAGSSPPPLSMSFNSVCGAASAAAVPTVAPTRSLTPTAPKPSTTTPPAAAAATPIATLPPTIEALAPTVSPTARIALADTGPSRPPPSSGLTGIWVLLGTVTTLLIGLVAFNLLRRGP